MKEKSVRKKTARRTTSKNQPLQPKTKQQTEISTPTTTVGAQADFDAVLQLIVSARTRAVAAVNTTLIELYWNIGEHIVGKIDADGWGKGTVEQLAEHIGRNEPNIRGFSARNLWRMKQFFETYQGNPKLSPLVTVLPWTHNLLVMSRCKRDEEREFYLRTAINEKWGKRELQRQLNCALTTPTKERPSHDGCRDA